VSFTFTLLLQFKLTAEITSAITLCSFIITIIIIIGSTALDGPYPQANITSLL